MNFNLLSQNLLLIVCGISTSMLVYLVTRVVWQRPVPEQVKAKRGRPKKIVQRQSFFQKVKKRALIILIVASIISGIIIALLVSHYTDSPLPSGFIFMVLPATLSASIVALALRSGTKLWVSAVVCLIISVFFSLLLINNYYRLYPTLGTVFNHDGALAFDKAQSEVVVKFAASTNTVKLNDQSVEGALNAIATQPTNGKVYSLNIPGTVSHFKTRTAYVYVPAVYATAPNIRLPVIILMPGFPGFPGNWLASGLQTTMDTFAKQHNGITPLVFVVDNTGSVTNDTECVDSPRGNAETYLTVDVPNYIKAHFNVQTNPSHWAIGGLSLGGTCAIMLALRHPDIYHYFVDLGGEIGPEIGSKQKTIATLFNGSLSEWQTHQPEYLLATRSYKGLGMGGFFGVGKQDTLNVTEAAAELSKATQKAGIETVYESINGQHTFNVFQQTYQLALPWVSNRIGATECRETCL